MSEASRLDRLLAWFPRHARAVLAGTLLLTLASALSLVDPATLGSRIEMDPSSDRLLPEGSPERVFFDRVRHVFGGDETLIVALAGEDVFTPEALRRIARLTAELEAIDGVDRVLSLANAAGVRAVEGEVEIAPFVTRIPDDAGDVAQLRAEVLADPIYGGSLVSRDGRVTALLVYFDEMSNREYLRRGIDGAIVDLAEREKGRGEVWVTGGPHVRAETARVLLGETLTLSLGILAALAGILLLVFRTVRGVLLPLLTIAVAVAWTMASVAWIGLALNAVTVLVPVILTALGLSYSVHVVSEYYEEEPGAEAEVVARVARATRRVALPVLLTGLTTAAGFASLWLSPLAAVREFGALCVLGVVLTMIASLTFTPAVLACLPAPRRFPPVSGGRHGVSFDRLIERVARFDVAHRKAIFVGAAVLFALALFGATRLRVGTQQIGKFRAEAPVRAHFEAVNEHLGGANPLYVVVESDAPDAFVEPANLRALEELQAWLAEQPEIGATSSLVDFVKLIHRGFREGDEEAYAVPESRRLVSQLLFFAGGEQLDRFVDSRYQMASVHVRARVIDSEDVEALTRRIEERLAELPRHLQGHVTGTAVVLSSALGAIVRGQAVSVVAALAIIYAILAGLFVSLRVGALALVPNVLPVACFFGALGLSGIRLDPGTSLVAPMVLGIAVDDTIHYLSRFIREVRARADEERATVAALKSVGRPVTYTTLALCAGFLVLTASELRSQAELGALAAFSLALAWLTDVTLTPALCARLRVATLWDFVTLDLGPDAHRKISLFRGLRAPQARIVALLCEAVHVRRGDRLFEEGEPGGAVYAVIDGRLHASARLASGPIEIGVHERGDVIGEVGLFGGARSCDVEAATDARLLRITQESLDQIARRYPRVATALYRNLSRLAAAGAARATEGFRSAAPGPAVAGGRAEPSSGAPRDAALAQSCRALAEAFFGGEGEQSEREGIRRPGSETRTSTAGGDPAAPGALAWLGVSPDVRAALLLVPLAQVAWADGRLDAVERTMVLRAASGGGLADDGPALERLHAWLDERPPDELVARWRAAVAGLAGSLSVESRMRLRSTVVEHARRVAEAAGGFLGVGSVSRREERMLASIEEAFEAGTRPDADAADIA